MEDETSYQIGALLRVFERTAESEPGERTVPEETPERYDMQLSDCDKNEAATLVALVALAQQLPGELTKYSQAIGEIREKYFNVPGAQRYVTPAGFVSVRDTRVTPRWR